MGECVTEAQGEDRKKKVSADKCWSLLGLGKTQNLGTTLIYPIQATDTEHSLGLLCFMTPILIPLNNNNHLFILNFGAESCEDKQQHSEGQSGQGHLEVS